MEHLQNLINELNIDVELLRTIFSSPVFLGIIGCIFTIMIAYFVIFVINPNNSPAKHGKKLLAYIPKTEFKKTETLTGFLGQKIREFVGETSIDSDNEKVMKEFMNDFIYSGGIILIVGGMVVYFTHNWFLMIPIVAAGLALPFLLRYLQRKEFEENYLKSFYRLMDYLILYTSGGINIYSAIEETVRLLHEEDVIKPNLQKAITFRNVSGMGSDSYMKSLEMLNDGVNLPEIEEFLRIISLQVERGTPITDSLYSQINYISQKETIAAKNEIAKAETTVTMFKTLFCTVPILILFLVPPMLEIVLMLSF